MSVGIKRLREDRDHILQAAIDKGSHPEFMEMLIDGILFLDDQRRALVAEVDARRAERKQFSRRVGALMRANRVAEAHALVAERKRAR